jgi:hypothetical protein
VAYGPCVARPDRLTLVRPAGVVLPVGVRGHKAGYGPGCQAGDFTGAVRPLDARS